MIKHYLKNSDGSVPNDVVIDEILALRCLDQEDPFNDILTKDIAELMCDSTDLETIKEQNVYVCYGRLITLIRHEVVFS